jgi:hypothetical protein
MGKVMACHLLPAGLRRLWNANRCLNFCAVVSVDVIVSPNVKKFVVHIRKNICILQVVPPFALIDMMGRA